MSTNVTMVHLIDPGPAGCSPCGLATCMDVFLGCDDHAEHHFYVLGTERDARSISRMGIPVQGNISPPLGRPLLVKRSIQRMLQPAIDSATDLYLWGWGSHAGVAISSVRAEAPVNIVIPIPPADPGLVIGLDVAMQRRGARVVTFESWIRDTLVRQGLDQRGITHILPGLDPVRLRGQHNSRAELRRQWDIPEETFIVALMGEPITLLDAEDAFSISALSVLAGHDVLVLLPPESSGGTRMESWAGRMGLQHCVRTEERLRFPWEIVNGIDAALQMSHINSSEHLEYAGNPLGVLFGGSRMLHPPANLMPLMWAQMAGLPVIAEDRPGTSGVVDDSVGFMIEPGDRTSGSAALIKLANDRPESHAMGARAAARARQLYGLQRARSDWKHHLKGSMAGHHP